MADIANGGDVINALDAAVDEINADIEANDGYGFTAKWSFQIKSRWPKPQF